MPNRSKVGRGNRKLVRDHFRKHDVTFQFGRDCINNRYSFKPDTGIMDFPSNNAYAEREKVFNLLSSIAADCHVNVDVHRTSAWSSYPKVRNFNVAVRFKDI